VVRGSNTRVDDNLLVRAKEVGTLCAHHNGQAPKTRKYVVANGFGQEHNLGVYNNNVDTVQRAFVERYFLCKEGNRFRPALSVSPQTYRKHNFKIFQEGVCKGMPNIPRLSRQQVVDLYVGRKKLVYTSALESLNKVELNERDARLTSFVKFEKQDIGKAPRVINPRSPRYNLELARFLKHSEKYFFKSINAMFGGHTAMTVIKGVNADVSAQVIRSKWDRFKRPIAIGLDASKFDMHVSLEALQYEHGFYKMLFNQHPDLCRLLSWQLVNSGCAYTVDGRVNFSMRGTRCSGDINTSLGNCLIMCSLIWVYGRSRNVDLELCNNGDDCVVILDANNREGFLLGLDGWFRKHGFAMVAEPAVDIFEQLEFCQSSPVQLSTGWRMIRNHNTVLKKDPMCLVPIPNNNVYKKWCGAVGDCGQSLNSGVPVQYAFSSVFKRNGVGYSEGFKEHIFRNRSVLYNSKGCSVGTISPIARVSYYYAFGLRPDDQVAMERQLDRMTIDSYVVSDGIDRGDLHINGPMLGA